MHHQRSEQQIDRPLVEILTKREVEVLSLLARGFRNKMIAKRLCVSPNTVEKHLDNIYNKLNVDNRGAAIVVFFNKL